MIAETLSPPSAAALAQLQRDGIAVLPGFVSGRQLEDMQAAFTHALSRMRVNVVTGFELTELHRDMVEHVLTLEQGFVDVALHPVVQDVLRAYIGPEFQLAEVKAWLSRPSRRDFHGWHGDEWYDQAQVTDRIPREVKLALYLTDVETGYFEYVRGSHQKNAPRIVKNREIGTSVEGEIIAVKGKAGTAFLFDTSGVHRQSVPILQRRHAVFYNYHESAVPLQPADQAGNRYHPLLLNAAFLGDLTAEEHRILGFGDKSHYRANHARRSPFPRLDRWYERQIRFALLCRDVWVNAGARLKRVIGR